MPVTQNTNCEDLTLMSITGQFTVLEVMSALERFYSAQPTRYVIWDLREADLSEMSPADAKKVLSHVSSIRGVEKRQQGKTAIVASSDLGFGIGRVCDSIAEVNGINTEVCTFRSLPEAADWLGVPQDAVL